MSPEVPKKFYRHVLKGVAHYSRTRKRACDLQDITAYLYLKNRRLITADQLRTISRKAVSKLCTAGVIKKVRNEYWLVEPYTVTQHPREELARPSSSSPSSRIKRKASPSYPTSLPKRQRRAPSRRSAVPMDVDESAPVNDEQQFDSDDDYEDDDDDDDDSEEAIPPEPVKVEGVAANLEQASYSSEEEQSGAMSADEDESAGVAAGSANP
ncbi:uncharacterized protein LOC131684160 isoform X2 [Topomyia yanbarensis]|nr:uncharacterized protein LOC131684160 isoform X2 [Topomyia yanbarensis]